MRPKFLWTHKMPHDGKKYNKNCPGPIFFFADFFFWNDIRRPMRFVLWNSALMGSKNDLSEQNIAFLPKQSVALALGTTRERSLVPKLNIVTLLGKEIAQGNHFRCWF